MSASASIVAPSSGASITSSSPERSTAERNTAAVSCASRPRSTGAKLAVTRPDSKRERSSSVLTSRSSRSAPRWATSTRSRWTRRVGVGVGQRVAERPEHQRQRGAELVRDVGEELGLGAVELGQLLGARLRGGQADGARQRARQLARDHAEEVAVAVVQPLPGAGAEDQRGGRHGAARAVDREQDGAAFLEHPLARHRGLGRAAPVVGVRLVAPARARVGHAAVLADQVQGRERHVLGRRRERAEGRARDLGLGARRGQRLAERGERLQPPRPEHARARLVHGGEHARDLAVVAADRAERVGEVGLLEEAHALEQQRLVLLPGGLGRLDDAVQHRPDLVPDLRPDVAQRHAHRRRVLGAQHRDVGVVVDRDEVGAPEDADRVAGLEADRGRGLQRARPALDGSQRCGTPIVRPQEGAALAAPGTEAGWPGGRPSAHCAGL